MHEAADKHVHGTSETAAQLLRNLLEESAVALNIQKHEIHHKLPDLFTAGS
jgi:hypothetical protein